MPWGNSKQAGPVAVNWSKPSVGTDYIKQSLQKSPHLERTSWLKSRNRNCQRSHSSRSKVISGQTGWKSSGHIKRSSWFPFNLPKGMGQKRKDDDKNCQNYNKSFEIRKKCRPLNFPLINAPFTPLIDKAVVLQLMFYQQHYCSWSVTITYYNIPLSRHCTVSFTVRFGFFRNRENQRQCAAAHTVTCKRWFDVRFAGGGENWRRVENVFYWGEQFGAFIYLLLKHAETRWKGADTGGEQLK